MSTNPNSHKKIPVTSQEHNSQKTQQFYSLLWCAAWRRSWCRRAVHTHFGFCHIFPHQ